MSLFDHVSNYCERTADTLWAEPLNAVSNIAFFIAAWLLYKSYKAGKCSCPEAAILIFMIVLIGIGSTLFHTFANRLTLLADVIPIDMFVFYYLWVCLRQVAQWSYLQTIAGLMVFTLTSAAMSALPASYTVNGSVAYFPCCAALFIIGWHLQRRKNSHASYLIKAGCWLVLSLIFRSIDFTICAAFPIGTHFLWHSINGYVLYLLTSVIIRVECR